MDFTQDDFDQLWYTEHEMMNMKQHAMAIARRIKHRTASVGSTSDNSHHSDKSDSHHSHSSASHSPSSVWTWHQALSLAYRAFLQAQSVHDLHQVMTMVTEHRDLLTDEASIQVLGLEKWLVRGLGKDRMRRRYIMMQEMRYWQFRAVVARQKAMAEEEEEEQDEEYYDVSEAVAEVCRDISRSSRMFAFHVGRMLAMQLDSDDDDDDDDDDDEEEFDYCPEQGTL